MAFSVCNRRRPHLADHAAELEQAVAKRTAKLRVTIGELEHFSYIFVTAGNFQAPGFKRCNPEG